MAATHLTLEEAAERLGLAPEEFKKRLKTDAAFKALVPIRDGSSLRFKSVAIEELARELGAASHPELPLAPLEGSPPDSDDFKVTPSETKKESKKPPVDDSVLPLLSGDSSGDDVFSLAPDEAKPEPKKKKSGSDSDVRLEGGKSKKGKVDKDGSDEAVVPTEELSLDFSGPGSAVIKGGSSAKLSAPKSSGKIPKPDSGKGLSNTGASDSSEFELSLDADSDDFELKLNTDASDEVDLGEMPKETLGSGKRGGESGINLREPADSGISLEKGKGKDKEKEDKGKGKPAAPAPLESDSDVDFELTLDSSAAASGLKLGGLKSGKGLTGDDSSSEFELTLDDSGDSSLEGAAAGEGESDKRDIFETDFEIPPMDESGSEAVALETDTDLEKADSDFDVEVGDSDVPSEDSSGSEVVLLEDETEEPAVKARKKPTPKKAATDDEGDVDLADVETDDEDASASKALKGLKGRRRDVEEEDEDEATPVAAGTYRPIPWGPLPALILLPALVITLIGGLMGFELLQTMWGYQQPRKPAAPLVRALATNLDMELRDQ